MGFGGWSIPKELFDTLVKILPEGKTILELGSGEGTAELLKKWNVISIEDNTKFVDKVYKSDKYKHTWIYAPMVRAKPDNDSKKFSVEWYSTKNIELGLKHLDYDLILVDGPDGKYGRKGFEIYYKRGLFKKNVVIVIDDLQAQKYLNMAVRICKRHNKILSYMSALSRSTSYGIIKDRVK